MTSWQEFPIRPQARPWAGINTRSGKLDDGTGQMVESSINCLINSADKLEKRKGFIRGIDQRFTGSVCGIHAYQDECGREWVLVADEGGFTITQPFAIPSFTSSDAYPSDPFQADGPVDTYYWRNTALYTQSAGSLVLKSGESDGGDMSWFKDATNFSYSLTGEWTLAVGSSLVLTIKAGAVAKLQATVADASGTVTATLTWIDSTGSSTVLGQVGLGAVSIGSLYISYSRDTVNSTYTAILQATPTGGGLSQIQDYTSINALSDSDFGQGTAVRLLGAAQLSSIQGAPLG